MLRKIEDRIEKSLVLQWIIWAIFAFPALWALVFVLFSPIPKL